MSTPARVVSFLALLVLALGCLVAAPAPVTAAPSVELLGTGEYRNEEGLVVLFGEVKNTGTVTVTRAYVTLRMFDTNGNQIDSRSAFTLPAWVKPGERVPFKEFYFPKQGYAYTSFQFGFAAETTHRANHDFVVNVTEDVVDASGRRRLSGTVRNEHEYSADFLEVIGTFYGPDGAISDATHQGVTGPDNYVAPGETVPWTLTTTRPVSSYALMAESSEEMWAPAPSPSPSPSPPPPPPGGRFTGLTPDRLLDTREGVGAPAERVRSGGTVDLQVLGRGGVPAEGVGAVALNVTVTRASGSGFVTAYPAGAARPEASSLNYATGDTRANLVMAKVGADGEVSLYNEGGTIDLIADVVGWFSDRDTGAGTRFEPVRPNRLLDTREGIGARAGRVPSGSTVDVRIDGNVGLPRQGVDAVVLNVTATGPTASGFVTVHPSGEPLPNASSLNYRSGQTVPNLVVAKVGADGHVSLYNFGGSTHLLADVVGWYSDTEPDAVARYNALTPERVLDTRTGEGARQGRVASREVLRLTLAGRGGVPPQGASAVVLNVTVTAPSATGFVTVYPSDSAHVPPASNLNYSPGQTVPNLVVVGLGSDGTASLYNYGGSAHLIADVVGWYTTR